MKKFIFLSLLVLFLFFWGIESSFWATQYIDQIKNIGDNIAIWWAGDTAEGIQNIALQIAESLKIIFYIIATIYFLIISIQLLAAESAEEEVSNFKKWLFWISVGLIVMNVAHYFVYTIYNQNPLSVNASNQAFVNLGNLGYNLLANIFLPFIKVLQTAAGFFFILIAIYAFFKLVTTNGNEENAKSGRMTIVYAIFGFLLIKIAGDLVMAVYGNCRGKFVTIANKLDISCKSTGAELSWVAEIITNIINWLNSFVWVVVIIMIIFAGIRIIFSNGDEEKLQKWKKSIIYIIIGIAILVANYLILQVLL